MAGHLLFVILMSAFVHEIQAQALHPPTLTVNTAVISETDSVTFHCQAPTSVSVHQCFFYTVSKNTFKTFSCLQNFTATELLLMSHQSSPAEVKVRCFYTGELNSMSADSEPSSITIQSQKPQMSVQHFNGEHVLFVCSLPGSVKDDTRCNLYFGEASRPTVWKNSRRKTKPRFCQFDVSIDDFLRHLHFVQQKEASCDYTLKREPRSLSPRSDRYNLTAILESESPKINKPPSIMTTESSLNNPSTSTSTTSMNSLSGLGALNLSPTTGVNTPVKTTQYKTSGDRTTGLATVNLNPTTGVNTPVKTTQYITSGDRTTDSNKTDTTVKVEESLWNLAAAVTRYGIVVGFILLVLGLHIFKRRTVEENLNLQQMKNENSDIYHVYGTISEETDAPDSQDMI